MSQKLVNKAQSKLRSVFISIITYIFFLGIGYLVARFIQIPSVISYSIFLLFGVLAVAIDIPDDKMKWLRRIPLLRRHFSMMHRVRQKIGISAKEGKISSAFKFVVGMVVVILYLFWMNVMLISIKLLLNLTVFNLTINYDDPFRFNEAFLSLLGAGFIAFLIWMRAFHRDYKRMKTFFKSQSRKDQARSVGKGVSTGFKLYTLFIGYILWFAGEFLFMLGSNSLYPEYIPHLLIGMGSFFILLIIILIFIVIMTKSGDIHTMKGSVYYQEPEIDE